MDKDGAAAPPTPAEQAAYEQGLADGRLVEQAAARVAAQGAAAPPDELERLRVVTNDLLAYLLDSRLPKPNLLDAAKALERAEYWSAAQGAAAPPNPIKIELERP